VSDLANWPALVLTAGLGTRLRPLSNLRAKAAMPVAGAALVVRILRWLHVAGIRRAVLNLHHLPASVTSVVGDGSPFGVEVRYSWEPVPLGSAGGPRRALPLLDADRFFVINGDTLTDCSLSAVAARHHEAGARVTMALVEGDVARYGGVLVDTNRAVVGFGRPTADTRALHFIGVQAVDADVFASLPDDRPSETVRMLYPQLIARQSGAVVAYESAARFLDIGTPRDYLETAATVAALERRPLDVGVGCQIAASARVEHSILWDRVTVGEAARLRRCVVADDVRVPPGNEYEDSVLMSGPCGVTVTPL
jgi:NDP-sugar pyrophosphorylase family protein